jgi:hypothetical protein
MVNIFVAPERSKPIVFLALLLISDPAHADITCVRIDEDPHNSDEQFFVSGAEGAFSYNASGGNRHVVELSCTTTYDDGTVGLLCARLFQRDSGFTTEHFAIPRVSAFATLIQTIFVENSTLSGSKHYGRVAQKTVRCTQK